MWEAAEPPPEEKRTRDGAEQLEILGIRTMILRQLRLVLCSLCFVKTCEYFKSFTFIQSDFYLISKTTRTFIRAPNSKCIRHF